MDKNIAAFLDTTAYTVSVVFNPGKTGKTYMYVCNIPGLTPGDWVVVDAPDYETGAPAAPMPKQPSPEAPWEFQRPVSPKQAATASLFKGIPKLVLVVGVDPDVAIAPDSDKEYGWVVTTLDMTAYRETVARNSQINGLVAEAYKTAMRKSFAERILGDMSADSKDKLLALLHK